MRTVVRVFSGEYDLTCQSSLRAELDEVCEEPNVVLDMRGVTFLDSTCVTELLRLHKRRGEKGFGAVTIVRNAAVVKRLFAILYFKTLFHLVDTLDEVLPKNGSPVVIQYACRGGASPLVGLPLLAIKPASPFPAWDSPAPSAIGG